MDYEKIGKFIANERKDKKLTQSKLAEKLFVSEKTISKWENGNGIPDTNSLTQLCEIFEITINELLNGERIPRENYTNKAEKTILELQKARKASDKRLLGIEIILGLTSIISFFIILLLSMYIIKEFNIILVPTVLIILDFIIFLTVTFVAIYIEQKAGFYLCSKCNHQYIPTYRQTLFAMHRGRTRYMKCPHCKKRSWHKKVLK